MDIEHIKKINEKIKKIKDTNVFYKIFNIVKDDLYISDGKYRFTENNNGIFFNLRLISEEKLIELENFLNDYNNRLSGN